MYKWLRRLLILAVVIVGLVISLIAFLPLKGHIPILMYHFVVPEVQNSTLDVSARNFEMQMKLLKWLRFKPISMDDFQKIVTGERAASGREIVITFDDGNETYVDHALPILTRFGYPSLNFVVSQSVTQRLHGSMDVPTTRQLAHNRLVTLGVHTKTHAMLTHVDLDEAQAEIMTSKSELEALVGKKLNYFSYPTGRFNDEIQLLVEDAGFLLGFTTSQKRFPQNAVETNFSRLRTKVSGRDGLFGFWYKISGLSSFVDQLKY